MRVPVNVMILEPQSSRVSPDRDETTGRFVTSYLSEDFTEALRETDGMANTREPAEAVRSFDRLALDRLAQLTDQGSVTRRKVANANL